MIGEGLGQHDRGRAVPASDVGDRGALVELVDDAVECRQPGVDEVGLVPGSEEPLGAAEESFVVFAVVDALPGAERLGHLRLPEVARGQHFEPAAEEHRAVLIGQDHGVFVGQLVAGGGRVERDVACCGLVVQPLADIPLGGSGGVGELGRGERPGTGHRLVQAELVTDVHQGAGDRHAHVGHGLVHERVELLRVDRHHSPPGSSGFLESGASDVSADAPDPFWRQAQVRHNGGSAGA